MGIQYGTRVRFIKMLLSRGFDINKIEYDGYKDECTLLHYAIKRNELDSVILLLSKGADINIQNLYGQTALEHACKLNHKEIFYELLAKNEDIDYVISQLFFFAEENNSIEIIQLFLINSEYIHDNSYYVWHFANKKGDKELLRKLFSPEDIIELCCDAAQLHLFSAHNEDLSDLLNLLIMICGIGDYEIYEKLLEKDLLKKYNKEIINVLESHNIDLFFSAILRNNGKLVQILLDNGINVDRTTPGGSSGLFLAIERNIPEIAKILLDNGADIKCKFSLCPDINRAFTYETYASYLGHDEIAALFNKFEFNKEIKILNNTCSISLKEYDEIKKPVVSKYGHIYEYDCIEKWLSDNDECPVTRKPLRWVRTDIFLLKNKN